LLTELSLLLGDNAYTSQLQLGRRILQIDREKFLKYLADSFSGQLPGMALSPLEVLSYMEQGVYEDIDNEDIIDSEDPPGLWLAFTMPFCLHEDDITAGVSTFDEWIERWEQPPEDTSFDTDINYKARVLKLLRTRDEDALYLFIRKANDVFRGALKLVYDEEKDRCIAIARANRRFVQEVLEDKHVALLMFMYYTGMTSRKNRITFEEVHTYFQRSLIKSASRERPPAHFLHIAFHRFDVMAFPGEKVFISMPII
jgi:hypothetical protein